MVLVSVTWNSAEKQYLQEYATGSFMSMFLLFYNCYGDFFKR